MRFRNICFTVNNPDESYFNTLIQDPRISYAIAGRENAPSTGTPHLQGYLELNCQISDVQARALLPGAHISARRGSAVQAAEYCRKEDPEPFEYGTISKQGARSDLAPAVQTIKEGGSMQDVAELYPEQFVRYHKGFVALKNALSTKRSGEVPQVVVLWGPTGTGKSHTAREETTEPYVWGPEMGVWFDGYDGHKHVIFEEFRGQLPFGMLLRLLDKYDLSVQVKGGRVVFVAEKIYITSPLHPKDWYTALEGTDKLDQLLRRITQIKHLTIQYTST